MCRAPRGAAAGTSLTGLVDEYDRGPPQVQPKAAGGRDLMVIVAEEGTIAMDLKAIQEVPA